MWPMTKGLVGVGAALSKSSLTSSVATVRLLVSALPRQHSGASEAGDGLMGESRDGAGRGAHGQSRRLDRKAEVVTGNDGLALADRPRASGGPDWRRLG